MDWAVGNKVEVEGEGDVSKLLNVFVKKHFNI